MKAVNLNGKRKDDQDEVLDRFVLRLQPELFNIPDWDCPDTVNNNNVFSRHLGHLRTVSFMKMGARFLAKFTSGG